MVYRVVWREEFKARGEWRVFRVKAYNFSQRNDRLGAKEAMCFLREERQRLKRRGCRCRLFRFARIAGDQETELTLTGSVRNRPFR